MDEHNQAPPPLVAPHFTSIDPTDPLSPDALRRRELAIRPALDAFRTLARIARTPEADPAWPVIRDTLHDGLREAREAAVVARDRYVSRLRFRNKVELLDPTVLINLQAAFAAQEELDRAAQVWRAADALEREIVHALGPAPPASVGSAEVLIDTDLSALPGDDP